MNRDTRDSGTEKVKKHLSTTQKFADERIQELTSEALFRCQDIDSTDVRITVEDGVVTLDGMVSSQNEVMMAEKCLGHITEIRGVENKLEVRSLDSLH